MHKDWVNTYQVGIDWNENQPQIMQMMEKYQMWPEVHLHVAESQTCMYYVHVHVYTYVHTHVM